MEKGMIKIKKGVSVEGDGRRVEERGYCKRCARSLHELLKEKKVVEVTALGSLAVANAMKAIAICNKTFEDEGVTMRLDAPVYRNEQTDAETSLAVFSITTRI